MSRFSTLDRAYWYAYNSTYFVNPNKRVSIAASFAAYYIGNPQQTFSRAYKKFLESEK